MLRSELAYCILVKYITVCCCSVVPLPAFACSGPKNKNTKHADYTLGRKINTGIELCLQPRGPSFKAACQSRLAERTELRRPGCPFTVRSHLRSSDSSDTLQ